MITFIWDPAVRWPPPANIIFNYTVVGPGGAVLSSVEAPKIVRGEEPQPTSSSQEGTHHGDNTASEPAR